MEALRRLLVIGSCVVVALALVAPAGASGAARAKTKVTVTGYFSTLASHSWFGKV
jgi:hypothetical protein